MHEVYLPFTEEELRQHFAAINKSGECIGTSGEHGYKFNEYKEKPDSLAHDLPHRKSCDWNVICGKLGWLTWEDCREVNDECCPWLD